MNNTVKRALLFSTLCAKHRLCHASRNGFAKDIFRVTLLVHNLIWSEWNKHIRGNWTQLILRGANWFSVELSTEGSCAMRRHSRDENLYLGYFFTRQLTVENGGDFYLLKETLHSFFSLCWVLYHLKEQQSLKSICTVWSNGNTFILLVNMKPYINVIEHPLRRTFVFNRFWEDCLVLARRLRVNQCNQIKHRLFFEKEICSWMTMCFFDSKYQNMLLNLDNRSPSMEWLQFCSFHFPRLYEGIYEQLALHFKLISHC